MILSKIVDGKRITSEACPEVFAKEYDAIVCGMGTAGTLAALFMAENGLKVLGVEQLTCVGGTHTAGGVGTHYFGCPGGRYEALDKKVIAYCQAHCSTERTEGRKLVSEAALVEKGVELLFETSVVGAYLEGNTVVGVQTVSNQQLVSFRAKIVLDCTAEASVAWMAGCEAEYGRALDGQTQPYSTVSLVYNGKMYYDTNVDFGRVNQLDVKALTDAIVFSRGYEMEEERKNRQFIMHRPLIGVREGRRIVPEETVRIEELFADKQTQTPMFFSYADLDKHGWDIAFDGEVLGDWAIGANLGAYNVTVAVPYRAILPKGLEGILVPCRALGVDRDISSCVRMVPDMKKAAEAGAEWATLAIRQKQTLRQVPYEQLREKLIASGCLDMQYDRGIRIDGVRNPDGSHREPETVHFINEPEQLQEKLRTETPGQGIWSAKRMGKRAVPALLDLLSNPEENTRKHAAFALASLQEDVCKPILRAMVEERDGFLLKDCRKHNNLRMCMAVYWLGRLGDAQIADLLMSRINSEEEVCQPVYQRDVFTTRYRVQNFNDVYFQFMSVAVMSLIRIGDANPQLRAKISEAFAKTFATDAYYDRITQRPKKSSEGNMVLTLKRVALSAAERWR